MRTESASNAGRTESRMMPSGVLPGMLAVLLIAVAAGTIASAHWAPASVAGEDGPEAARPILRADLSLGSSRPHEDEPGCCIASGETSQEREVRGLGFESLGHFGGAFTGVVVSGTLAYASHGVYLDVYDVSDPALPQLVDRSLRLPVPAKLEVVNDSLAFLVYRMREGAREDEFDELFVVDMGASPPEPTASLRLPRRTFDQLVVRDTQLLAASYKAGMTVVDVSDPASPAVEGVVDLGGAVTSLAEHDDMLLAAVNDDQRQGEMLVMNVVDPLEPEVVGRVSVGRDAGRAVSNGRYALVNATRPVSDWNEDKSAIIDMEDPQQPELVGDMAVSNVTDFEVAPGRLWVLEAPIAVRAGFRVKLVDISQLPEHSITSEWRWYGGDLAVVEDRALHAAGPDGLRTLAEGDVDGASVINELSRLSTIGNPQGVVMAGDLAYVTDVDRELWVLDLSNESAPSVLGRAEMSHRSPYALREVSSGALVVRDGLAYVSRLPFDFIPGGLHVFDVSDPTNPGQVGFWDPYVQSEIDPESELEFHSITGFKGPAVDGDRAWLMGDPEVTELDISDPTDPTFVRLFELPHESLHFYAGDAGGLALGGQDLFFAALHRGVHVLDAESPGEFRHLGSADTPGSVKDVALSGDYLVAVGEEPLGFRVLDANTLASVRSIESISAAEVEIVGETAYAVGYRGVTAVDLADPAMPVVRGTYDRKLDYLFAQTAVRDSLMVLTTGAEGLELVQLVEGPPLPDPTAGPTLTPWPTRGTLTSAPPVTPLATRTPSARWRALYVPIAWAPIAPAGSSLGLSADGR